MTALLALPVAPETAVWGSGPASMWQDGDFARAFVDGNRTPRHYLHVPYAGPDDERGWAGTIHRLWPRVFPGAPARDGIRTMRLGSRVYDVREVRAERDEGARHGWRWVVRLEGRG